jgi:hypothetical protein
MVIAKANFDPGVGFDFYFDTFSACPLYSETEWTWRSSI